MQSVLVIQYLQLVLMHLKIDVLACAFLFKINAALAKRINLFGL
jgi:hypothetical protein